MYIRVKFKKHRFYLLEKEFREFCEEYSIHVQAFSPALIDTPLSRSRARSASRKTGSVPRGRSKKRIGVPPTIHSRPCTRENGSQTRTSFQKNHNRILVLTQFFCIDFPAIFYKNKIEIIEFLHGYFYLGCY